MEAALKVAYSRLDSLDGLLMEAFPLPYTSYTNSNYVDFVLKNKLGMCFLHLRSHF